MMCDSPSIESIDGSESDLYVAEETGPSTIKYCYNKGKTKKPKRNKSAFILFSIETRAKIKAFSKNGEELNSNQMMEKLANLWKSLPKKEHERFNRLAENDKVRYQKELDEFWKQNPSEVIQNRTKKNHVKKPCSAYALFVKDIKEDIKKQYPKIKMADVLKIVSEKWKILDQEKKDRYQERSDVEKEIAKAKLEKKYENDQTKFKAPAKKEKKPVPEKEKKVAAKKSERKKVKLEASDIAIEAASTLTLATPVFESQKSFQNQFLAVDLPILEFKESALGSSFPSFYSNIGGFQPETLIPPSLQNLPPLELPLLPQESKITITTDNLFPSEKIEKRPSINLSGSKGPLKDQSAKTEIWDFLNFDHKPTRLDSLEPLNKSSVWMDSNRFGSNNELSSAPTKDYAPKISRSEILNNAIMSALDYPSLGIQDDIRKDDDFFSLGILKFGM